MARVLIHNPSAPAPRVEQPSGSLVPLAESRAGILANGKQHAELVMSAVVDRLAEQYGVIKAGIGRITTSSRSDPAVLEEMSRAADWVIVGSAD